MSSTPDAPRAADAATPAIPTPETPTPETPTLDTASDPVDPALDARTPEGALDVEATGVEVRDVALDGATVRRAPRYRAFFWAGAVVGLLVGLVVGLDVLSDKAARGIDKPGVLFAVILLGGLTVGLLAGGFAAVVADRRSVRRRPRDSQASQA